MYKHWHDEQNSYTKIVLKTAMAKGQIETVGTIKDSIKKQEMADASA
jgi:hypothetical protein